MFRKCWVNRDTFSEASLEFLSIFIIYLAALGLSCNTWDCAWHLDFSLVYGAWAPEHAPRLSSCNVGLVAPCMWDLISLTLTPVSVALEGGFFNHWTTWEVNLRVLNVLMGITFLQDQGWDVQRFLNLLDQILFYGRGVVQ